ncbi:MAG: fibronectin type III domain-containing protein [Candidatus Peribacteria bacterium]|nr:MAG: fibronectin type III domain-containing protein [Candidatus Peribacteria bacterium]
MKSMASGFLAFVLLFSPFHLSYAATELTTTPTLSDSTTTSLSIDWDEVEGAAAYYVYYDVKSGVEDGYTSELSDIFDVPGAEITDLEPGTTYYVAVTVFDENGEESNFSPEAVFTTKTPGGVESFALESIEVASKDTLHLHFNADLDDAEDAERAFKITSDTAGYHEYSVIETELVSPEVLAVTLDDDMIV